MKYRLLAGDLFSLIRLHNDGTLIFDHWDESILLHQNLEKYLISNSSMALFPLIFSVEDNGVSKRQNWIGVDLIVDLLSWSGAAPMFPVPVYRKFVPENSPLRKILFELKAANRLMNVMAQKFDLIFNWKYSLELSMAYFKVSINF